MSKQIRWAFLAVALCAVTARSQTLAPSAIPSPKAAAVAGAGSPAASPAKVEKKEKKSKMGFPGAPGATAPTGPMTTEIYADEASFDSAKYVGVFTGHVIVQDPRFNLQSDKLTIFIRKGADAEGSPPKEKTDTNGTENGGEEGLEKAIAEGNVGVVKETADPKGGPPTRAVGRSDKAVYTTKDGNVELTGSPRVQQGLNSHVSTSADTVMILNESGQLTTHGPSRTEIRQEPKPSPAPETAKPETPKP